MGKVHAVSKSAAHEFSKQPVDSIHLTEGQGVDGDAHRGVTVKHRSRVRVDPTKPNLRQIHLIHYELIQELQGNGFNVQPATMGENITTEAVELLSLPTDTLLKIGPNAEVKVTGLRNPCLQLDNYQQGLMAAVLDRDEHGGLIRRAGIMGIVLKSGVVNIGDRIEIVLPSGPYKVLGPV
ncbi:MAG: MOSC domain-containing protein [Pseudomonadota bacterium]